MESVAISVCLFHESRLLIKKEPGETERLTKLRRRGLLFASTIRIMVCC